MIKQETFSLENIKRIQKEYGVDPELAQRAIFALGLVESLLKVKTQFIFKGGSSLMLLFDIPKRLSTDVDIIVDENYDIDGCINKASNIFPFISVEESIRLTAKNISKKHYRFTYLSPIRGKEITVILDVLFAKDCYAKTISKPINNVFLINDGDDYIVKIPSIESILGDKLTAFAPHTIGIRFNNDSFSNDKRLEVIKQFYDVSLLFDVAKNYEEVQNTYHAIAEQEIKYRNLNITPNECLMDSFNSALSLLSFGKFYKDDYQQLLEGINRIKTHIVGNKLSMHYIPAFASKIMLLSACLIKDINPFSIKIEHKEMLKDSPYNQINFLLKISNQEAYDYAVTAINILFE